MSGLSDYRIRSRMFKGVFSCNSFKLTFSQGNPHIFFDKKSVLSFFKRIVQKQGQICLYLIIISKMQFTCSYKKLSSLHICVHNLGRHHLYSVLQFIDHFSCSHLFIYLSFYPSILLSFYPSILLSFYP